VERDEDLHQQRELLNLASRSWTQERDGKVSVVRVDYSDYPEIGIILAPASSDLEVRGQFRENGSLRRIEISTTSDTDEVTAADLRNLSSVRTLKAWEIAGRETARQIIATGNPFAALATGDARNPGKRSAGSLSMLGRTRLSGGEGRRSKSGFAKSSMRIERRSKQVTLTLVRPSRCNSDTRVSTSEGFLARRVSPVTVVRRCLAPQLPGRRER